MSWGLEPWRLNISQISLWPLATHTCLFVRCGTPGLSWIRDMCIQNIWHEYWKRVISRCSRVWWRNNFFSESAIFELSARYFELGRHCEHRLSTPDFNLRGTQNKRNTYNEVKSLEVIFSDTRKRENNRFSFFRVGEYRRPEPHNCPCVTLIRVRNILYFYFFRNLEK